jgi:hypothetical protein
MLGFVSPQPAALLRSHGLHAHGAALPHSWHVQQRRRLPHRCASTGEDRTHSTAAAPVSPFGGSGGTSGRTNSSAAATDGGAAAAGASLSSADTQERPWAQHKWQWRGHAINYAVRASPRVGRLGPGTSSGLRASQAAAGAARPCPLTADPVGRSLQCSARGANPTKTG